MQVLNIFHVLVAIAMVALILVQRGAGATAGAAFGSGASGTVFGARGAGNFLTRSTWILGTLFCAISLTMAVVVTRMSTTTPATDLGVVSSAPAEGQPSEDTAGSDVTPPAGEVPESDLPPQGTSGQTGSGAAADDLPSFEESGDSVGDTAAGESGAESSEDGL